MCPRTVTQELVFASVIFYRVNFRVKKIYKCLIYISAYTVYDRLGFDHVLCIFEIISLQCGQIKEPVSADRQPHCWFSPWYSSPHSYSPYVVLQRHTTPIWRLWQTEPICGRQIDDHLRHTLKHTHTQSPTHTETLSGYPPVTINKWVSGLQHPGLVTNCHSLSPQT